MIPREDSGNPTPLSENLNRHFLYVRYNAELSDQGLACLGLSDIDPETVKMLDSVEYMDDLSRVGQAVARQVSLTHLGPFAPSGS